MKLRLTRARTLAGLLAFGGICGGLALATRAQNPASVTTAPQLTPEQTAQKIAALEKQVADLQAEVARLKTPTVAPSFSLKPSSPSDKELIFNGKTYRLELLKARDAAKESINSPR